MRPNGLWPGITSRKVNGSATSISIAANSYHAVAWWILRAVMPAVMPADAPKRAV
jgi:hypothetical protein